MIVTASPGNDGEQQAIGLSKRGVGLLAYGPICGKMTSVSVAMSRKFSTERVPGCATFLRSLRLLWTQVATVSTAQL
jgi:hypothetical protein